MLCLRLGSDFHLSRPVFVSSRLSTVTNAHTYIHTYIYTYMHTQSHTFIYSYIHKHTRSLSCTYIHTEVIYTIALTTLSLDSTKSKKRNETKQNNKMSSPVCLTQRYHQVYTSTNRQFTKYISFSPAFYQVLPLQPYIYCSLSVSCSPTMTASTTLHLLLFYPCIALQQ